MADKMRFQKYFADAVILPDVELPEDEGLAITNSGAGVAVLAFSDGGDSWHSAVAPRGDLLRAIGLDDALMLDTTTGEAVFRDTLPVEALNARAADGDAYRYQPLKIRKE